MFVANCTAVQPEQADFMDAAAGQWAEQLANTALEAVLCVAVFVCFTTFSIRKDKRSGKVVFGKNESTRPWSYAAWAVGNPRAAIKAAEGNHSKVLQLWRTYQDQVRFTDVCNVVVSAYLAAEPFELVREVVDHLRRNRIMSTGGPRLLEAVAEARDVDILDDLLSALGTRVPMSYNTAEMIITTYAAAGDETRLDSFMETARVEYGVKMLPRHYVAALRGMLSAACPEQAMKYAKELVADGYRLNPRQLTEVYQSFTKHGRAVQGIHCGLPEIVPTSQAILCMMDSAARRNDIQLAGFLEDVSQQLNIKFHKKTLEAYVRILVANNDPKALQIFPKMLVLGAEPPSDTHFHLALYKMAADSGRQDICQVLAQGGASQEHVAPRVLEADEEDHDRAH